MIVKTIGAILEMYADTRGSPANQCCCCCFDVRLMVMVEAISVVRVERRQVCVSTGANWTERSLAQAHPIYVGIPG